MNGTTMRLLAKLEDGAGSHVPEQEIYTIAQYLGVDISAHPKEHHVVLLRDELSRQNTFLSGGMDADAAKNSSMYKQSQYVREIIDRGVRAGSEGQREITENIRASVQDVERALLTVCDVMNYPLYVANETGDKRIIRFVAELAAEVFGRVQVKFKELVVQLESEDAGKGHAP